MWPDILCKDVDGELRPIIAFLMQLGMEVSDLSCKKSVAVGHMSDMLADAVRFCSWRPKCQSP